MDSYEAFKKQSDEFMLRWMAVTEPAREMHKTMQEATEGILAAAEAFHAQQESFRRVLDATSAFILRLMDDEDGR